MLQTLKTSNRKRHILFLVSAGILLWLGVASSSLISAESEKTDRVTNLKEQATTLVRAKNSDVPGLIRAAEARGIDVSRQFSASGDESVLTLQAPQGVANLQLLNPLLSSGARTYPNYEYRIQSIPNDPEYSPDTAELSDGQWNLEKISAEAGWDITKGSEDVTIAIIDSGILFSQSWGEGENYQEYTHPDISEDRMWVNEQEELDGQDTSGNGFIDDIHGWDFMGGWVGGVDCPNYEEGVDSDTFIPEDNDPQPYSCDSPTYPEELNKDHYDGTCIAFESACYIGHGTAVASIAAAATDNDTLIAGIDWNAKIMNIRVFDGYGYTTSDRVVAAVDYATDMGADVINLSLAVFSNGSCQPQDEALEAALKRAHDNGVVVVAAAGNGGIEGVCYPANSDYTIAVGATDKNDELASFSTYGPELDLIAPGDDVPALNAPSAYTDGAPSCPQPDFCFSSGTSLSTPHVTGVAALIKSIRPEESPEEIRRVISYNADKTAEMDGHVRTDKHGYGRLNLLNSLLVKNSEPGDGISYEPLDNPREMRLIQSTQKTDLLTLGKAGNTLSSGQIIRFETKTYINGTRYLRSQWDTDNNNHWGIPFSELENLPAYEPLDTPREMRLIQSTQKTDLLSLNQTGGTISSGTVIRFEDKVRIGGTWYLRSKWDQDRNNHMGIPLSLVENLPTYEPLDNPREMRLIQSTQKTDLLTLGKAGNTLSSGQIIRFETKTYINGTRYLRSQWDTDNNNHWGIPFSELENI